MNFLSEHHANTQKGQVSPNFFASGNLTFVCWPVEKLVKVRVARFHRPATIKTQGF
jgi:hypothetical protein